MVNFDASSVLASLPRTDVTRRGRDRDRARAVSHRDRAKATPPGRADRARLPVANLTAVAQGDGQHWASSVRCLRWRPAQRRATPRVSCARRATGHAASGNAALEFDRLRTDGLHASAPALRLDGAMKLDGTGTDFRQPVAVDGRIVATPVAASARSPRCRVRSRGGATVEVSGTVSAERIELSTVDARAGATRAQGKLALSEPRALGRRYDPRGTGLDPEQWMARAGAASGATAPKRAVTALDGRGVVHVETARQRHAPHRGRDRGACYHGRRLAWVRDHRADEVAADPTVFDGHRTCPW